MFFTIILYFIRFYQIDLKSATTRLYEIDITIIIYHYGK